MNWKENAMNKYRRIVVKVGSSTLTYPTGNLNIRNLESLVKTISDLKNRGLQIVLVTSGAVAVGMGKLRLHKRPSDDIPTKQACAAVGQCELMKLYDDMFGGYNHIVAQLLLTAEDFGHETRSAHFVNTMERLLELDCLPIINENDTVATKEIVIGDNDTLSAMVAGAINADLLVIMSDIDGLYTGDPNSDPDARLVPVVKDIDAVAAMAGGSAGDLGVGGMVTKMSAARIATASGTDMAIINGSKSGLLYDIVEGNSAGTLFPAGE